MIDFGYSLALAKLNNKAFNDQGKDEGTIIVTAQLNLNMSLNLN